ncbi:794_t:CDS:1, partial [Ambispora leptoticha]
SPNSYILGDSGYVNTDWLLVLYRDNRHLTIIQQYYNYMHSATHIRIEQAF